MEQMYSLSTVAKMWDMSVKTLRRLLREADIELLRIGRNIKVKELLAQICSHAGGHSGRQYGAAVRRPIRTARFFRRCPREN